MKIKLQDNQAEFLNWEFGVFFHFGIRTFYPGHYDWDGVEMPGEKFNPKELDCEQWIRIAKEGGAKYAILTTKHHDGFALWPSKYSRYSVKNTPWKNGTGDVVKEFVNACRKYGLKVGLYYSPAQWGSTAVKFSEEKEYDDYFINQISEILTNYGKIDYLWFDGCGSEGHVYDKKRIVTAILTLQPDILTFCDPSWMCGVRWCGNEDGYMTKDNPLVVNSAAFSIKTDKCVYLAGDRVLPAECDCRIRTLWFYNSKEPLKETDELLGMYESTVGRGSNFLLNIGPDDRGLLPEEDSERFLSFGRKVKEIYNNPLAFGDVEKVGEDSYRIVHPAIEQANWDVPLKAGLTNRLVIEEDLSEGQSVTSFRVFATLPGCKDHDIEIYEGKTIGHKHICVFPTIRSARFTVEITGHDGTHSIKSIKACYKK